MMRGFTKTFHRVPVKAEVLLEQRSKQHEAGWVVFFREVQKHFFLNSPKTAFVKISSMLSPKKSSPKLNLKT